MVADFNFDDLANNLEQDIEKGTLSPAEQLSQFGAVQGAPPKTVSPQRGGGSSSGNQGNTGTQDSPQSAAAEQASTSGPSAQRDDPDDGIHKASTAAQDASQATQTVPAADGVDDEDKPTPRQTAAQRDRQRVQAAQAAEDYRAQIHRARQQRAASQPSKDGPVLQPDEPAELQRNTGFKHAGESIKVSQVPEQFVTAMRQQIEPIVGEEFAYGVSYNALIAGFLANSMGIPLTDPDHNTEVVTAAFAQLEPELSALTDQVAQMGTQLDTLQSAMQKMAYVVGEGNELLHSSEFASSVMFYERIVGLQSLHSASFDDVLATNMDAIVQTRSVVRRAALQDRRLERERKGRQAYTARTQQPKQK